MVTQSCVNSYNDMEQRLWKLRFFNKEGEMETGFQNIAPEELADNPFKAIGSDWMLITAGVPGSFNTMTASWGALGILWNKPIAICFVRAQRHTFRFLEQSDYFSLSFFPEEQREALKYCGTHSGRDVDKIKATGLTPLAGPDQTVYFAEARLVLFCKKIYIQDLDPSHFLTPETDKFYPQRDYHRVYLGEITHCLRRE